MLKYHTASHERTQRLGLLLQWKNKEETEKYTAPLAAGQTICGAVAPGALHVALPGMASWQPGTSRPPVRWKMVSMFVLRKGGASPRGAQLLKAEGWGPVRSGLALSFLQAQAMPCPPSPHPSGLREISRASDGTGNLSDSWTSTSGPAYSEGKKQRPTT